MKKTIAIFSSNPCAYAPQRLAEEASKKGLLADTFGYREVDLYFGPKGKRKIFLKGKKMFKPFWGAIFRSSREREPDHIFTPQRDCLLENFFAQGTQILNQETYRQWPLLDKITEHFLFSQEKLPIAASWVFGSPLRLRKKIKLPAVLKLYLGSHGKQVFKVETTSQLKEILNYFPAENFLVQEVLPKRESLRVVVLEGKALGATKRKAPPQKFATNSVGSSAYTYKLDNDRVAKTLAEKTAKICKADFCGIDLIKDSENQWRILEINTDCQFKSFENTTGINVAQKVIEFLINKDKKPNVI
ncbi:hypothetical protein KBI33_03160 [Candidatus Shapirobacteria bacterium]|nr:hypothetical protein [Candidatus Shapirobacteria bacterium]